MISLEKLIDARKKRLIPDAESTVKRILQMFPNIEIREQVKPKFYFNFGPIHIKKTDEIDYKLWFLDKRSKKIIRFKHNLKMRPLLDHDDYQIVDNAIFKLYDVDNTCLSYTWIYMSYTKEELYSDMLRDMRNGFEFLTHDDEHLYTLPAFSNLSELELKLAIRGEV